MYTPLRILMLLCLVITIISCSSSSDDDTPTEPQTEVDPDPLPNQTSTYIADVKTIIDTHCVSCHSNPPVQAAPMSLETYTEVVAAVNNRDLFGRMVTNSTFNVMPQSGRLPDATILIVEDWIADGLIQQ